MLKVERERLAKEMYERGTVSYPQMYNTLPAYQVSTTATTTNSVPRQYTYSPNYPYYRYP